jgi:hypothetical protein
MNDDIDRRVDHAVDSAMSWAVVKIGVAIAFVILFTRYC